MPTFRATKKPDIRSPRMDRKALRIDEAAAIIGVSRDWFLDHVLPEVETIRRGRMTLVPVHEIDRWLEAEKCGVGF